MAGLKEYIQEKLSMGITLACHNLPYPTPMALILTRGLNMGQLIEELSRNLTLSYFSAPRLYLPGGIENIVDIGSIPNIY